MRRKTSFVWEHFREIGFNKAKCSSCSQVISFTAGSIGNLSRHLRRRHPTRTTEQIERQSPIIPASPTIEMDIPTTSPEVLCAPSAIKKHEDTQPLVERIKKRRSISPQRNEQIDNQLMMLIVKDHHPLRLLEDAEFKKFVSMLCPSYSLPTTKTLTEELLPQLFLKLEQEVFEKIASASDVCLTTDAWTSMDDQSFIAVTAHYINEESMTLNSNLLGSIEYDGWHTAENVCSILQEHMLKWNIGQKVGAIVSDSAANILSAAQLGGWRSIHCFAHQLNAVVEAGIEEISEIVGKVKNIVEYFQRSPQAMYALQEMQEQMNLATFKLKQDDVPTRWNSTYSMLDRVAEMKNAIIATLALEMKNEVTLSNEDWTVIENVIPILKDFMDVTVEISTEKHVSLSKVIVFCKFLIGHINHRIAEIELLDSVQDSNTMPVMIKKLLKTLNEQMQKGFHSIEKNSLYAEATILDPRFKNKGFRDANNFNTAFEALMHKVAAQTDNDDLLIIKQEVDSETSAKCRKTKTSSFWDDFDNEISTLAPAYNTAAGIVELQKYMNEPIISRSEDPLQWWNMRRFVYPILFGFVLKRLNLVASSAQCSNLSKTDLIQTNKLSGLSTKEVAQLLFINSNI